MQLQDQQRERVRQSSTDRQNQKITNETISNVELLRLQGSGMISQRLKELDEEWDVERTLEVNAGILGLSGVLLGTFVHRNWFILPGLVGAFLAQHAIQGWCPPLPLFRSLGIRTRAEIDREKYALKSLRGDFRNVSSTEEAWSAVEQE